MPVDDLELDLLELIFGFLSPADLCRRARRVSSSWAAVASSTPLWWVHSDAVLEAYAAAGSELPVRVEGEPEAGFYFRALQHFDLKEVLQPWRSKQYKHLRRLGDVTGEGTSSAHFSMHGIMELPQPSIVFFELLRLYAPVAKSKKACLYRMVAKVCGHEHLHQALRRLHPKLDTKRGQHVEKALIILLKEPWPQAAISSNQSGAQAVAAPQHMIISLKRARQQAEGANLTLVVENALLREENTQLRRTVAEQAELLRLAREQIHGLTAEAREVRRLRLRLEQLETNALDGNVSEVRRLRSRLVVADSMAARQKQRYSALQAQQARTKARAERAELDHSKQESQRLTALRQANLARSKLAKLERVVTMERGTADKLRAQLRQTLDAAAKQQDATRRVQLEQLEGARREHGAQLDGARQEHVAQLAEARREAAASYHDHRSIFIRQELQPVAPGGTIRLHNRTWQRIVQPQDNKGSADVSQSTKRRRTQLLEAALETVAGGSVEHVEAQRADQVKARRKEYAAITSPPVTLDIETACGICNESSGTHGHAIMRTLKESGVKVPTKAARKAFFQESWHETVTGTIEYPDPKKRGRILKAAWLRVISLLVVLQTMARRQAKGGTLSWDGNTPADEYWFQLVIDKGGTTTKVLLKFLCVEFSDSVRHSTIVGLLDKVKDTYEFEVVAFGPLLEQLNEINRNGICIFSEWHPRVPRGFYLRTSDARPERYPTAVTRLVTAAVAAVVAAAAANRSPPPTDAVATAVSRLVATAVANIIAARGASHAAHARAHAAARANLAIAAAPTCNERRPDCRGCARWKGGCPTAARAAFSRNGSGGFPPQPCPPPPLPRQLGCTWCGDCEECCDEGDALEALREQWSRCKTRSEAPRRLRGFVGGDWMSQTTPLGIGGPTSKQFCPFCLASLHETNAAGSPTPPLPLSPPPSHHQLTATHRRRRHPSADVPSWSRRQACRTCCSASTACRHACDPAPSDQVCHCSCRGHCQHGWAGEAAGRSRLRQLLARAAAVGEVPARLLEQHPAPLLARHRVAALQPAGGGREG